MTAVASTAAKPLSTLLPTAFAMAARMPAGRPAILRHAPLARQTRMEREPALCDDRRHSGCGERSMTMRVDLAGKVALVTGASSGLGERFAQVLAANF